MTPQHSLSALLILSLAGLSGCMRAQDTPEELVAACQAEVAAAGTYVYEDGAAVPVVTAVEDGTSAGEAALNACIQRKAASQGLVMSPAGTRSVPACYDGAPTLVGGTTYCIGNY